MASEVRTIEAGNQKLKTAYNQLMQKYANLKTNMKQEMERMMKAAKTEESLQDQKGVKNA